MDNPRAEVVGSLLRPLGLVAARKRFAAGEIGAAEFKAVEDEAIRAAVLMQEAAGIDVVTDGEFRRFAFYGHLIDAFEGFDREGGWAIPFRDETGEELILKRPVVTEKLRWKRSLCGEEWTFLRSIAVRSGKVTILSAQQAAAYYDPDKSQGAYPSRDEYLADVVDVSRREVEELVRLGCTYIQVDAPQYAALLDPKMREGYRSRGSDPEALIDRCIELDNAIIANHPGVTFGLHVCRGNNQSKYYAEGDYEPISRIFEKSLFNRFLLEYDDARSGGFEPLRHLPADRTAVLGLITTKKEALETDEAVMARIAEAARIVPLERLALSPQCGFASTMEGNRISFEREAEKLALVGRVARAVWG